MAACIPEVLVERIVPPLERIVPPLPEDADAVMEDWDCCLGVVGDWFLRELAAPAADFAWVDVVLLILPVLMELPLDT